MKAVRIGAVQILCLVTVFLEAPSAFAQSVEEIYVVRSLRESRESPSEFCSPSRTGFGTASVEDRYGFWSTEVRGSDGRVLDAHVQEVGRLQACFGPLPEGGGSFFYAEGALGSAEFTGRGDCRGTADASPEPGIGVVRCFMVLSDLPPEYVAGHLTTNTVNSQVTLGAESDPAGYTQPSIATVRLWRRR